jgi:hypothetical protein
MTYNGFKFTSRGNQLYFLLLVVTDLLFALYEIVLVLNGNGKTTDWRGLQPWMLNNHFDKNNFLEYD